MLCRCKVDKRISFQPAGDRWRAIKFISKPFERTLISLAARGDALDSRARMRTRAALDSCRDLEAFSATTDLKADLFSADLYLVVL